MRPQRASAAVFGVAAPAAPAASATIDRATWNMTNLQFAVGEPCRSNTPPGPTRTEDRRMQ
jgi:hypothetical protein